MQFQNIYSVEYFIVSCSICKRVLLRNNKFRNFKYPNAKEKKIYSECIMCAIHNTQ